MSLGKLYYEISKSKPNSLMHYVDFNPHFIVMISLLDGQLMKRQCRLAFGGTLQFVSKDRRTHKSSFRPCLVPS